MYKQLEDYVGKQITYKQICSIAEIKYHSGKAKTMQVQDISRYYSIIKNKTKYLIVEKYNSPLAKEDKRIGKMLYKDWIKFDVNENFGIEEDYWRSSGVYYICDNDKNIYIGSTIDFKLRYQTYKEKPQQQQHVTGLFNNGGKMKLLWPCDFDDSQFLRKIEAEYIHYFKYSTGWNVVNKRNELIGVTNKPKLKQFKVPLKYFDIVTELLMENNIPIIK